MSAPGPRRTLAARPLSAPIVGQVHSLRAVISCSQVSRLLFCLRSANVDNDAVHFLSVVYPGGMRHLSDRQLCAAPSSPPTRPPPLAPSAQPHGQRGALNAAWRARACVSAARCARMSAPTCGGWRARSWRAWNAASTRATSLARCASSDRDARCRRGAPPPRPVVPCHAMSAPRGVRRCLRLR